ncbi:MAG: hypothetical protein PHV68_03455 [Candidatus Gastranaerophilales bacterium]|nr:hypothetical protein [Candidatus Gastranaerophilales bacterium]
MNISPINCQPLREKTSFGNGEIIDAEYYSIVEDSPIEEESTSLALTEQPKTDEFNKNADLEQSFAEMNALSSDSSMPPIIQKAAKVGGAIVYGALSYSAFKTMGPKAVKTLADIPSSLAKKASKLAPKPGSTFVQNVVEPAKKPFKITAAFITDKAKTISTNIELKKADILKTKPESLKAKTINLTDSIANKAKKLFTKDHVKTIALEGTAGAVGATAFIESIDGQAEKRENNAIQRAGLDLKGSLNNFDASLDKTYADEAAIAAVGVGGLKTAASFGKVVKTAGGEIAEQAVKNANKFDSLVKKAPKFIRPLLDNPVTRKVAAPVMAVASIALVGTQLADVADVLSDSAAAV